MLNHIVLMGRLTRDPELRRTGSGIPVATFTLAVDRDFSNNRETGEKETDFIDIVVWRNTAEFITRYFKKGSAICVTGSIQTRTWNDQQGNKRYATEVVVDEAFFVDNSSAGSAPMGGDAFAQAPAFATPVNTAPATTTAPVSFDSDSGDEDLPF